MQKWNVLRIANMHSILDFKSISLSALLHIPFSSINGAKYFKTWIFYKTKVYQLPSGRRVFSRMQQGGLQYSKVKLVDNDIVFFFVVASLQCFAFKPKIPWTWLERIECRRKTCIMHIANFKSFRCGTQILGRFLMISEFCSLCILKKSHGIGWPNVPKVELEISTPLQIKVLNEISAWLKL